MPKKKNFLGGMQNYNAQTGEYEPALKGPNGERPSGFKSFKKGEEKKGKSSFDDYNDKRLGKETPKNNKSGERKDKYGNPLLSDDAFKVGQKAAQEYLDQLNAGEGFEKAKGSFVTLGGFQDAISDALEQAGYNQDYDLTYQDLNEIVGSVTGEEVDFEDYEGNGKGWTGKKYDGYVPKDNDRKKLTKAGFSIDDTYSGGDTYEIYDKDTGRFNSITLSDNGKYYYAVVNGTVYYYKDLDTAIDRATYKSGKAPYQDAIGWEKGGYDSVSAEKQLKELRR